MDSTIDPLSTLPPQDSGIKEPLRRRAVPRLEILFHYDLSRIGKTTRADLFAHHARGVSVGREHPTFFNPASLNSFEQGVPLQDPCISRKHFAIWWKPETRTFMVQVAPGARLNVKAIQPPDPLNTDGQAYTVQELGPHQTPFKPGTILAIGSRALLLLSYKNLPITLPPTLGMVGESEVMWSLRDRIRTFSKFKETVLILGETGSGKEMVARALHEASGRTGNFVAINMSSLDPGLANGELFGHRRGAFTDAHRDRQGSFEAAQDGTLFLDEIGDTPMDVQKSLLRVLEEKKFLPVGGEDPRHLVQTNARIVVATNKSLVEGIDRGTFRKDLFERLRGLCITVPPLRNRREDVPLLFAHFLKKQVEDHHGLEWLWTHKIQPKSPPLPIRFLLHKIWAEWSGNVRELKNLVAATAAQNLHANAFVEPEQFDDGFLKGHTGPITQPGSPPNTPRTPIPPSREELLKLLREHDFNQTNLSEALGIARQTLISWMDNAKIKRAKDFSRQEIIEAYHNSHGDIRATAHTLMVSLRSLKLRVKHLQIDLNALSPAT